MWQLPRKLVSTPDRLRRRRCAAYANAPGDDLSYSACRALNRSISSSGNARSRIRGAQISIPLEVLLPLTKSTVVFVAYNLPRRGIRNAAVAVGAAALREFGAVERRAQASYDAGLAKVRVGRLPSEQLADLLDKEIIPDWVKEQQKLAALKGNTLKTAVRHGHCWWRGFENTTSPGSSRQMSNNSRRNRWLSRSPL
jgi:hypothetical protein